MPNYKFITEKDTFSTYVSVHRYVTAGLLMQAISFNWND